jgi:hypothetical protein
MVTPEKPPPETAISSEKYYELHEYKFDAASDEGLIERIFFPLERVWYKNKGDLDKLDELAKIARERLAKLDVREYERQQRLAERVRCYRAMPPGTTVREAARSILGDGATKHEIDAMRQDINRGLDLDATGGLVPSSLITSGSSVDIPPPLDKKPRK